jgi:hypothetical protein
MVDVPRFAIIADSKHYGALYNIVTNLILYQDPDRRMLTQKLDTYRYSLDRQARHRFVDEAIELQARVRNLQHLVKEYEDNAQHLTNAGKLAVIEAKQDTLDALDSLHLLFEAVAVAQSQDAATAALKSSVRLEAYAGEIAWHMLGDQHALIAKLAIKGIGFTWLNKKDGSTENAMVIKDLQALNTSPDALFPEMVARYGKSPSAFDTKVGGRL